MNLNTCIFLANPNDLIEIKFDLSTVDTLQGLHAYMNTMLNTNEDLIRFCLRKISYYWGYREGQYTYYMLAPPWVKLYIVSRSSDIITTWCFNLIDLFFVE